MKTFAENRNVVLALLAGSIAFMTSHAFAQTPFDKFSSEAADSERSVDYSAIDRFYSSVTVQKGSRRNFRYSVLKGSGGNILDAYVRSISSVKPTQLSKDEQLAYWLNLRNLLVVQAIAAETPVRNLKNARGDFDAPGDMWTRKRVTVEDVSVSIDDIERNIILKNWNNPNLIYGLYQGVKGGAGFVPPKAFKGTSIEEDLRSRAAYYINLHRTLRVKKSDVRTSAIYDWYKASLFGGDDQQIIAHLKSHAQDRLAEDLKDVSTVSFVKMDYKLDEEQVREQQQRYDIPRSSAPTGS